VVCRSVGRSVCLPVCHSSEPCKNSWTDRDAVWVEDSCGPRQLCIRWGQHPQWEGEILKEEGRPIVMDSDTLPSSAQKRLNRRWCHSVMGSDRPNESQVRWGPDSPMGRGNFWRGAPIIKHRDFLPWAVQNGWTNRFAVWLWTMVGRRKHKFNHIRQVTPMCPHGRAHAALC